MKISKNKIEFFSVVIPLYNKEKYIARAIESVLNQSFDKYEILVIDDGSTDNSSKVVSDLSKVNNRVKLYSKINGGESSARNLGISLSSAPFVCFLDADDEWKHDFLEEIVRLSTKYTDVQVFGTGREVLRSLDDKVTSSIYNPMNEDTYIIQDYYSSMLYGSSPLSSSSTCVSKSALIDVGMFPEGIKLGPDILTWIKLFEKYEIAFSQKVCSTVHQEAEGRVCVVNASTIGEREFSKYIYSSIYDSDPFKASKIDLVSRHIVDEAAQALRLGDAKKARKLLSDSRIKISNFKGLSILVLSLFPGQLAKLVLKFKTPSV